MPTLLSQETLIRAARPLIRLALAEDLGTGDVTTEALIDPLQKGSAQLVAKEPMVVAGLAVARSVFETLDPDMTFQAHFQESDRVAETAEATLVTVTGNVRRLLKAERIALNFLQRLCGIATQTRHFVELVEDSTVKLVDTRKTLPGWRMLEKYAVRVGGAHNHRFGLYDGVLIKDNHIAAAGGIAAAIRKCRANAHHLLKIEIETADLDQVRQALEGRADVIMLDNMTPDQIRQAVALIDHRALVEISGGVNEDRLGTLSRCGADLISVGALTHAARSMDISMRLKV